MENQLKMVRYGISVSLLKRLWLSDGLSIRSPVVACPPKLNFRLLTSVVLHVKSYRFCSIVGPSRCSVRRFFHKPRKCNDHITADWIFLFHTRGYIEDWEEQGKTGKNKQLVPCKDHQFCLDYVKQRPGDFPCYKSIWSHHPCYKGRRYGCRRMGFPFESMKRCWHEILTPPYYWAYSHIANPAVSCSRDEWCLEESSLFIDWLEEFWSKWW